MRVKSNEILGEGIEKLLCIFIDGKIDKGTFVYNEIED